MGHPKIPINLWRSVMDLYHPLNLYVFFLPPTKKALPPTRKAHQQLGRPYHRLGRPTTDGPEIGLFRAFFSNKEPNFGDENPISVIKSLISGPSVVGPSFSRW